jgi:hypothetical protein
LIGISGCELLAFQLVNPLDERVELAKRPIDIAPQVRVLGSFGATDEASSRPTQIFDQRHEFIEAISRHSAVWG